MENVAYNTDHENITYNADNENYMNLADDEKKLIGLDENERYEAMEKILNELYDDELMSMFRDQNSWDGSFEFCDGFEMSEFLSMMIEGKKGQELIDFILEVVQAVNDYDGDDDIEDAQWGYFDIWGLSIKSNDDIIDEARSDYLSDLAEMIVDNTHHISDTPSEVEDVLNLWEMEDNEEFLNEDDD